jgi:glycosyltransferase involved in cell wall biosynthesis
MVSLRTVRPARLVILGDGPGRSALEAHIAEREAGKYVELRGQVPQEELSLWLTAADVFALNTAYEGLSHTMLEAFAVRTPVVTTPVGGNIELVQDGTTGLLVAHDDVPMLAAALLKLLEHRDMAHALAEHAFQSLQKFSKEVTIEAVTDLVHSICAQNRV